MEAHRIGDDASVAQPSEEQRRRFDALWAEHHGFLLAYALRRLDSEDAAQEAVAEAFGNAWLHRRKVPGGPAARLWMTRATFHAVSNLQRRQVRDVRLIRRMSQERGQVSSVWPESLTDAQFRLAQAMTQLSMQDQELLRLANWEGFDHAQIATVMQMSTGNVAVRLHRVRARLRKSLETPVGQPDPLDRSRRRGTEAGHE